MNVQMQGTRLAMMPGAGGLDSTRQRQERQAQRDSEVAFFERESEKYGRGQPGGYQQEN